MPAPKQAGDKAVKPKAPATAKTAAKSASKTAAAKPAPAAKAAEKKPAVAKATKTTKATKTPPAKASGAAAPRELAPDQRRYYIEVAAYYIAERRGFHGGGELDDWVAAEEEIDRLLRAGILNP